IIGIGVGLGAQSLVKDIINGVFIILQDMISVGDWVQVGAKSGLVEAIGLRATRLRDGEGNVHIIPNSSIDSVTNMTKVFSRYMFDVHVSYKEDVDRVMTVLEELGREMQADTRYGPDILQPLEIFGLDRFAESSIVIRARVTTKPMKQWEIGREFNRRIKKIFDQSGIEMPFPHRTVCIEEVKGSHILPVDSAAR
ncbi:MAG: mechanosensitive ion channel family protein, partial [Deltaproteobacteria bacterium]|nr:mechanosensitive ion channel family protein [Deltaproteobacteria bacterium]